MYFVCLTIASMVQTAGAQIMLKKAAVDNGGGIATNGTTSAALVAGQTAAGTASNSQMVGHFGFIAVPTAINAVEASGVGAINSVSISPNPASGDVHINVTLASPQSIDLLLYDASGRFISTIYSGKKDAGTFSQHFDTKSLSSGAYFVAARIPGALVQSKLNVVK